MKHSLLIRIAFVCCACILTSPALAKDYYLTIGGGYSPASNQASLERNVLSYQHLLSEKRLSGTHDIFFADGSDPARDLQVVDPSVIPQSNRLMAEFFGSQRDLGLSYRDHQVPRVIGETSPKNIESWFEAVGPTMQSGDRLILYVTAHGAASESKSDPFDTSISLWNEKKIRMTELVAMLDRLPAGVSVVAIMVQCHAGGFARFIYNGGNPEKGISAQSRCGFFATVHDRSAAGCTPEVDEASYVEYSTYFWQALAGRDRLNRPIELPDYDRDGQVSFAEAHAYTVLCSDTIDLPIKTSEEFLKDQSRFRDDLHPDLLPRELSYDQLLEFATPVDRAVLEGLSIQLEIGGGDRLQAAERSLSQRRSRWRGRYGGRSDGAAMQLRERIAEDLLTRWPELANLLNPLAIELLTTRSADFVYAIEVHPEYQRYRGLADNSDKVLNDQEKRVKFERFIRAAENVILRENLLRMKPAKSSAAYQAIVAGELATLATVD